MEDMTEKTCRTCEYCILRHDPVRNEAFWMCLLLQDTGLSEVDVDGTCEDHIPRLPFADREEER